MAAGPSQWEIYMARVPQQERDDIEKYILNADLDGYDAVGEVSRYCLAKVAAGKMPPDVAREVRQFVKLILDAVHYDRAERLAMSADPAKPDEEKERLDRLKKKVEAARAQKAADYDQPFAERSAPKTMEAPIPEEDE